MNLISNKKIYWTSIFVLSLLSFVGVYTRPLTLDELNTINLIEQSPLTEVLLWIKVNDTQMPLFYIFADILCPFTYFNEFTLRLPSMAFVISALVISYKHLSSKESLYIARKYLLLSILCLYLFKEGLLYRPYGLLFLLSTLSYIYLDKSKTFPFFVSLFLLSITHYFGIALTVGLYLKYLKSKRKTKKIMYMNIAFLMVLAIFISLNANDILKDFFVIHTYRTLSLEYFINQFIAFNSGPFVLIALIFVFILDVPKKIIVFKDLYIGLVILLLCLIKASFSTPIIEARYFIIILFPYLLIISKYSRKATFNALCLSSLISFYISYPYNNLNTLKVSTFILQQKSVTSSTQVTSCDMTLKYYIPSFKDCYDNKAISSKYVYYIENLDGPSDCSCYREIKSKYKLKAINQITNAKVHYFEKKE